MPDVAPRSSVRIWSWSIGLMVVLTGCYALQYFVTVYLSKPYDAYLALSGYGIKSGHLWELITYQFLHTGLLHLLVNLVGLWFLGRRIESELGSGRFIRLYVLAGLIGGVLQGAVAWSGYVLPEDMEELASMLRDRFGGEAMGASVGLFGCLGAFRRLHPNARLKLIPISAARWGWVVVALLIVFITLVPNPTQPHLAHLGGFLTGLLLGRRRQNEEIEGG